MPHVTLSIRVDSEDKKAFESFCVDTGMNVSVAVNMFIKAVLRENRLPFDVTVDPFYSQANMERLKKAARELEAGKGTVHELIED